MENVLYHTKMRLFHINCKRKRRILCRNLRTLYSPVPLSLTSSNPKPLFQRLRLPCYRHSVCS